jgi:hypothetical protein
MPGGGRDDTVAPSGASVMTPRERQPGAVDNSAAAPAVRGSMPVMTYQDLPDDIRTLPLTDPAVQADVVDLMVGIDERRAGAVGLMVCDDGDRGIQPIVVTDLPEGAGEADLLRLLDLVLPLVGEARGALLVGRGRRRGLVPSEDDRCWHRATIDACGRHGVRLLGFHLASPEGVVPVPHPLEAAS